MAARRIIALLLVATLLTGCFGPHSKEVAIEQKRAWLYNVIIYNELLIETGNATVNGYNAYVEGRISQEVALKYQEDVKELAIKIKTKIDQNKAPEGYGKIREKQQLAAAHLIATIENAQTAIGTGDRTWSDEAQVSLHFLHDTIKLIINLVKKEYNILKEMN